MCGLFYSIAGDGSVAVFDPVRIAAKSAEKSKRKRERRLFFGCCKAVFFAEFFEYIVGYGSAVTEFPEKCVGVNSTSPSAASAADLRIEKAMSFTMSLKSSESCE